MSTVAITIESLRNKNDKRYAPFDSVIRTVGLTKIFPNGRLPSLLRFGHNGGGEVAVDDVSLNVPRGSIYGYIGPNGAGKTTTIKMLVGLLRPTSGLVLVCGHTIRDDLREAQRHIGYMPDSVKLPSVKAVTFLETLAQYSKLSRTVARSRVEEMLSWAGLDDTTTLNTKVNRWSAGMQRKLLFIQAMLHEPDVLILDEPTANLDPIARRELIELLKQATEGYYASDWRPTVLVSSHDLPEIQEVSTMLGFLNHGKLIAEGSKETLQRAMSQVKGSETVAFQVTGTGLKEITKEVSEKLGASVSAISDTELAITTKRGGNLFRDLARIAENHPDVSITNMTQGDESLESLFLKLVEETHTEKKHKKPTQEEHEDQIEVAGR